MVYDNVLAAMGNTPMIRLSHMVEPDSAQVLVKYEGLNVGGSIKTRTAYNMIAKAEEEGLIGPDTVIVEPTSGNQGIGLALIGDPGGQRAVQQFQQRGAVSGKRLNSDSVTKSGDAQRAVDQQQAF